MSLVSRPNPLYRPWWKRWTAPYIVLVLTPVVTLPLTFIIWDSIPSCQLDEPQFKSRDVALALLPTAADLLPFLWLASRTGGIRWAALIAGLIGAARFAIPELMLLSEVTEDDPQSLAPPDPPGPCEDYPVSLFFFVGMLYFMPILWAASALLAGLAVLITRANPSPPPAS